MSERNQALNLKTKLGFGVGDLGGNLFFTIMGFYLLFFFSDVVGLALPLAGAALAIGKVWDAVTDPAVGYFSDRVHTRWGRRRPFIFLGAILLFVFMVVMFTDPGFSNGIVLFLYLTVMYCILNTAYTLVNIPYGALTPELTEDFNERTVLNGYRMSFAVVGTFIGGSLVLPITNLVSDRVLGWSLMGGVMGLIMMTSALITFATVRETKQHQVLGTANPIRSYLDVLKMKTFLTALIPWTLHITGVNVIQAGLIYYFRGIYRDEAAFQIALPILLGTTILFIPVWVKLSERLGKKLSYNIGMGIVGVAALAFFLFGHRFDVTFAYAVMFVAGTGLSTNYVMPFAIVPDVVEYDYAENGVRREGVFYGMWTFVSKIGQAVAIGLTSLILWIFGHQAATEAVPNPVQSELAQLGIRLINGPIPALFFLAGIIVLSYYPITKSRYEEILQRARQRDAGDSPRGSGQST